MIHPVDEGLTPGQRAADWLASVTGSWAFLIIHSILICVWVAVNTVWFFHPHWDPYPYILLNLILSLEAAYTNPVILMAQQRQTERDRALAAWDHEMQTRMFSILEEQFGKAVQQMQDGTPRGD